MTIDTIGALHVVSKYIRLVKKWQATRLDHYSCVHKCVQRNVFVYTYGVFVCVYIFIYIHIHFYMCIGLILCPRIVDKLKCTKRVSCLNEDPCQRTRLPLPGQVGDITVMVDTIVLPTALQRIKHHT